MTSFASAVENAPNAHTDNGMSAFDSTANACVDLFYNIGASRGKNVIPAFAKAFKENKEIASRIALWARDVRGGAGERQLYRDILTWMEKEHPDFAIRLMYKTPLVGRWDDLLAFATDDLKNEAFNLIALALSKGNGLCAKWMPRKGSTAIELRKYMELTPKEYRKMLVESTNVVESSMCAKDWNGINFSQVPSLASARYRSAFKRNAEEKYAAYVASLVSGEDPKVKVNTGAVYPYDVLKSLLHTTKISMYGVVEALEATDLNFIKSQWKTLPNFIGNSYVLPMIDTSGSMSTYTVNGMGVLSCMDVAVSLGLYCAEKNSGPFKDVFLTFSETPELQKVTGDIEQKVMEIYKSKWGMSTNLIAAIDKVLHTAIQGGVPQHEMPAMIVIFSDMQFDQCASFNDTAMKSFKRRFAQAGYDMPKIVFWNLHASSNVPVKSTESGVALVSGFSPSLMTSLLSGNLEDFTPENIMLETILSERYDF